ncbi:MAG: hypothetical protein OXH75_23980 [Acidobacteria bacterium]|nr:hypothetical protein [Acidobacteriota bacterium]
MTRRADLWPIAKVRPRTGAVASAGDFCRACVDKLKAEAEAAGQPWLRIPELFED